MLIIDYKKQSYKLKFYIIQQFNEAGKVVMLNEWFDPSSIETQIKDYLEN